MASTRSGLNQAPEARLEVAPSFRFFQTAAPLCHFIDYFYCSDVPRQFVNQIDALRLPEVEAQLVFAIEEGSSFPGGTWLGEGLHACLFLQPAHVQVIPIPGTIRYAVGAALRPAGLRLLLPAGAECLTEAHLFALEDLWGTEGRSLLERLVMASSPGARLTLLEKDLQARVQHVAAPSRTVTHALQLINAAHGAISTERLARACGCSSRTLRSLTTAESGLAPKHLARIVRIRRALELLSNAGVPLSDAAANSAFADQAHMSREFRDLLGEPPSQLRQRIRCPTIPSFRAERNLMSTGLLVIPKSGRS